MSTGSKIEWTMDTWNFLIGCKKKSAGCKECYAIREAWIHAHHPNPKIANRFKRTVRKMANGDLNWTGEITIDYEIMLRPLLKKKPTTFFLNSMSDLWYERVPFEVIDMAFAIMLMTPQHTYQILTKRPERALLYFKDVEYRRHSIAGWAKTNFKKPLYDPSVYVDKWPIPNVFIGASVEDQEQALIRIPALVKLPAAVHFLSCEPLLAALDITNKALKNGYSFPTGTDMFGHGIEWTDPGDKFIGLDWVIAGGESGPLGKARPMHPAWARSLRDQCKEGKVPFFFKQWGNWKPIDQPHDGESSPTLLSNEQWLNYEGGSGFHGKEVYRMRHVAKSEAGRLLDRIEYNEMPKVYESILKARLQ